MNEPKREDRPIGREPVSWEDLTRGWGWPLLLRVPLMCLAPERLVVGLVGAGVWWNITSAIGEWRAQASDLWTSPSLGFGVLGFDPGRFSLWGVGFWSIVLVLMTPIGVAIGRSTIERVSLDTRMGMLQSAMFTLRTWKAWLGAAVIQCVLLFVVMGLASLLWGTGILGLSDLGFLLAGVGGLLWVALLGLQTMIPAAIGAECSDGMDAIQRSASYFVEGLLRWLLYVAIVAFVGVLIASIIRYAWFLGIAGLSFERVERRSLVIVEGVVPMVVWGVGISYWYTASAIIYLLMRKGVDRQDIREVWGQREDDASS